MTASGNSKNFDVIVIGGGHAGAEAAWASARLGEKTALVTLTLDTIGQMSCNPAIGGVGKGQIVREIDALGGLMGLAADATGIQFRMLNASKGPAVRGPRCQSDRSDYAQWIQNALQNCPNLTIIEGEATEIITRDGQVAGVKVKNISDLGIRNSDCENNTEKSTDDSDGSAHGIRNPQSEIRNCSAVIVTAGTFLAGVMHCGEKVWAGGRYDEPAASELSESLRKCGLELGRMKTGTCPRIAAESIDYDKCVRQDGDEPPKPFSFMNDSIDTKQIPCWLSKTSPELHDLVRENFHRAPMYTGQIQSVGPRYCPSFETKVDRFADKDSHQVFLEPEGRPENTNWVYCNGITTSLPTDVQDKFVRMIPGLENAEIIRYGYAIEYDFAQPTQLFSTLESKATAGLYLAGQVNGTTGYEEAGALGLLAAVNAVRKIRSQEPITLRRDQAYIGVMIDDLITKGVAEPYRMFTSRAEHRLLLRADNADRRLTQIGRDIGLVDDERWNLFQQNAAAINEATELMQSVRFDGKTIWELLRRPNSTLAGLLETLRETSSQYSKESEKAKTVSRLTELLEKYPVAIESLAIDAVYAGYIEKQSNAVAQLQDLDSKKIPADLDYHSITQLRWEARERLSAVQPANLGQALRISGITPSDITVLAVRLSAWGKKD